MPLCQYCEGYNLGDGRTTLGDSIGPISLGTVLEVEDRAQDCNFCALVIRASKWDDFAPHDNITITPTDDGFQIDRTGAFLVPMLLPDDVPETATGYGRIVRGKLRPSAITNWMSLCRDGGLGAEGHVDCKPLKLWTPTGGAAHQGASDLKSLTSLRLVNVKTLMIEDNPLVNGEPPPYAILSYVQGGVKKPNLTIEEITDHMSTPFTQPEMCQTHWDVITLVKKLDIWNIKHVWIDELCLVNDSKDLTKAKDLTNAMDNMDRIYAAAQFTIIAADGDNPHGGITATTTHRRKVNDQMRATVLPGVEWGLVRSVYNHLMEGNLYGTRGWTLQELVLSRRCLVFADKMAFWLCRETVFSEDTFIDQYPADDISDGMRGFPLDTAMQFIPPTIDDPITLYAELLSAYRERDMYGSDDSRNAFLGILNRINLACGSTGVYALVYALPTVFFDVALIWWHRPDRNIDRNVKRYQKFPSWSWMGWQEGVVNQFVPGKTALENSDYIDQHTGTTYYWWRGPQTSLYPIWDSTAQGNLLSTGLGLNRSIPNPAKPSPSWTGTPDTGLLQFDGTWLQSGQVEFYGTYGMGNIRSEQGDIVGACYADDQRGRNDINYGLILLSKAGQGRAFDSGGTLSMNINGSEQFIEDNQFYLHPNITADQSLYWVMIVKDHSLFSSNGIYERVGLGWIKQSAKGTLQPSPTPVTIVLG